LPTDPRTSKYLTLLVFTHVVIQGCDRLRHTIRESRRNDEGHLTARQYVNMSSDETPIRLAIVVSVC
jgi:hypothetical protein